MREMSDIFEFKNVGLMRHDRAKSFDQMFARNFIRRAIDKAKGKFHILQSADPAASIYSCLLYTSPSPRD